MISRFYPWKCGKMFVLGLVVLGSLPGAASGLDSTGLEKGTVFEKRILRGFGSISATEWRGDNGGILEIVCEDDKSAMLTHAKYLSDLVALPGIESMELDVSGTVVTGFVLEGKGVIAALRAGNKLHLVTAPDQERWRVLVSHAFPDSLKEMASVSDAVVPMWLDRWDRFGFQFYYRPWERPKGLSVSEYDITREFTYAREQGVGLALWSNLMENDAADGQTDDSWWDWARAWAREENVPISLHLTTTAMQMSNWAMDRWRDETVLKMPQFLGNVKTLANPFRGAVGMLAWGDGEGRRAMLGIQQERVAEFSKDANLVAWMEPHLELAHAGHDIYLDYGPASDRTFRAFLKERYPGGLEELNKSWQTEHRSWESVRVPEVASFAGWGPDALDLSGTWKALFPGEKTEILPEWTAGDFDDSKWAEVVAPGTDRNLFLPKAPAVYRRTFEVPEEWLKKNPRPWLYVWDLNYGGNKTVAAHLNGEEIFRGKTVHGVPHRMAIPVEGRLKPGKNHLTLELPSGYLGYRIYLSSAPARTYPLLGKGKNVLWADFWEWRQWTRTQSVKLGLEMIRGVDPDRQIAIMHPDDFVDDLKEVMEPLGGTFHNTGYMSAFWSGYLPAISRGSRLPFSLEPGSPADSAETFRKYIGLWHTEGVQGIDYFIHIGSVLWDAEIRKEFERIQPLIRLFGKYHGPEAKVAVLHSTNIPLSWRGPWINDPDLNLSNGYVNANAMVGLTEHYAYDAVTEGDFGRGHAARYPVLIDSNTSVMDESLAGDIEEYVRAGGTFVTFVQTGRHSPQEANNWPISRLTGYEVVGMEAYQKDGSLTQESWRNLKPAPGQTVFGTAPWMKQRANGLTLKRVAEDAQDLLLWEDGTVAVGMRKLGKGKILQVGCKWHGASLQDRIGGPLQSASAEIQALSAFVEAILESDGVSRIPAELEHDKEGSVFLRQFVSNNGLYDVWILWNTNPKKQARVSLRFTASETPVSAIDVMTGKQVPLADGRLADLDFEPLETRVFLTRRPQLASAPSDWFALQRDWWRGGGSATGRKFPVPEFPNTLAMRDDWAWHPVESDEIPDAWIDPEFDDSTWERLRLGIFNTPERRDVQYAVFRRSFVVPAAWKKGRVELWLQSWYQSTFVDEGRVWLDGKLLRDWDGNGIAGIDLTKQLLPGSKHVLVLEVRGKGSLNGMRGNAWLTFVPTPASTLDLSGAWIPTLDLMSDQEPVNLPGPYKKAKALRRTVFVPKDEAGRNAMFAIDASGPMLGVIVNGNWVRRHHHAIGETWDINVTPWIRFGEENEIELVALSGPGDGDVRSVAMKFYDPSVYP